MMTPTEEAVELFSRGKNCSQAIFTAFTRDLGMDRETAMRLASAFGGGMGGTAGVCGALTGVVMALGLRFGTTGSKNPTAEKKVRELFDRFSEKRKTLVCRELLDCDISTPGGMKQARREKLFKTVCPAIVEEAASITEDLL